MVKVKKIRNNMLYQTMVEVEKAAYDAQDNLLNQIEKYLSNIIDSEVVKDKAKVILSQTGNIQIRTIEEIPEEDIEAFAKEFGFSYVWFRDEFMRDFRNVEEIDVRIFEYGFIPTNIDKILGDNQVERAESSEQGD